jgi:hypothetical protein
MSRKPRPDAKLKTLPPALQAELFTQCQTQGYAEVKSWLLAKHTVATSVGSLSQFYAWFPLQRRMEQAATFATQLKEQIAQLPALQGKASEISDISQIAFEMQAVQSQDAELYFNMRKLRLKERDQALTERRIALLEKKAAQADKAAAITGDTELSDTEKAAQMRALFGMG